MRSAWAFLLMRHDDFIFRSYYKAIGAGAGRAKIGAHPGAVLQPVIRLGEQFLDEAPNIHKLFYRDAAGRTTRPASVIGIMASVGT
jgi:hypothetical protein